MAIKFPARFCEAYIKQMIRVRLKSVPLKRSSSVGFPPIFCFNFDSSLYHGEFPCSLLISSIGGTKTLAGLECLLSASVANEPPRRFRGEEEE